MRILGKNIYFNIKTEKNLIDVRPIIGYEGLYEVTSDGEVYSLSYYGGSRRVRLKEKVDKGYLRVNLYKDGKMKSLLVHRLVAEAFTPNPECKPQIDHINTNKTDNRVENLRWVTRVENMNNPITVVTRIDAFAKAIYCIELDMVF